MQTQPEDEKGYGPIIVCLNTSASMQGEAEKIAKALTLEALRIAHNEKKVCYACLFSGQVQVLEHSLDFNKGGLTALLYFLSQTFHGGTDVIGPLIHAMEKQSREAWQEADILLVTDGHFSLSNAEKIRIDNIRKHSQLRIHGVLIGQWQGKSMQQLCDHFYTLKL